MEVKIQLSEKVTIRLIKLFEQRNLVSRRIDDVCSVVAEMNGAPDGAKLRLSEDCKTLTFGEDVKDATLKFKGKD